MEYNNFTKEICFILWLSNCSGLVSLRFFYAKNCNWKKLGFWYGLESLSSPWITQTRGQIKVCPSWKTKKFDTLKSDKLGVEKVSLSGRLTGIKNRTYRLAEVRFKVDNRERNVVDYNSDLD